MTYLRKTSNAKLLGHSGVKGFPLILWSDYQVDFNSLKYFLSEFRHNEVQSVFTYARHINDFLSQLEVDGKAVSEIDEDWLRTYRDEVRKRPESEKENTENYASQVLRTVVNYCYWLTNEGIESYLCGPSKLYKIQVVITDRGKLMHSTFKNEDKDKQKQQAPRSSWIEVIKAFGPKRADLVKRFELMIDWGVHAGLRPKEICNLKIEQLPLRESAERAIVDERLLPVKLTLTKGRKPRTVRVYGGLILATWDYIELYRPVVVNEHKRLAKMKKDQSSYGEPTEIFLSSKSGLKLDPVSLSTSIRTAFKAAVSSGKLTPAERVWAHGLRHHFTTRELKIWDDKGQKNAERLVMQQTGHSSIDTMEPYMSDRYSEDFE